MTDIPLIRPNPPKLTQMRDGLEEIEASGIYANNGPVVRRLEREMTETLFGGVGGVVTTANATLGLMIAIKQAVHGRPARRALALMPSFTFAAAAQAALWAGMTPLLCDIEQERWTASAHAEEALLKRFAGRIGVIVPYATFGTAIDLDRYAFLARRHDVNVVVDAASSLGTTMADGRNFGAGSRLSLVYSMHATKTFAAGEGGVIYSADLDRLAALRTMASFGFGEPRMATMPGLNAKMSEIAALLALGKLREIQAVVRHRAGLARLYQSRLQGFGFQMPFKGEQALQVMAVLLPSWIAPHRALIVERLSAQGIGSASYFSPHLAEQPYLAGTTIAGDLPVTNAIASRVLSLPLSDGMTTDEVLRVTSALREACDLVPVHESVSSEDGNAAFASFAWQDRPQATTSLQSQAG